MKLRICPVRVGFTNCYLIQSEGTLLVDTPAVRSLTCFCQTLEDQYQFAMKDVEKILVTHAHVDHFRTASDLRKTSGAKVVVHRQDRDWLEKGFIRNPPGVGPWGKLLHTLISPGAFLIRVPGCAADLVIDETEYSLEKWGIPGTLFHTPGHTPGSLSLLLHTGEAFVGDLAMNRFPLRWRAGLPVFAEDVELLQESWRRLLERGAETVFPAHGDPFPADVIRQQL